MLSSELSTVRLAASSVALLPFLFSMRQRERQPEKVYLTGWTTIYTGHQDGQRGLAILRGMAMRDLAERAALATCPKD